MEQRHDHWKAAFITLLIIVGGTLILLGAYFYFHATKTAKKTSQNTQISGQPSLSLSPSAGQAASLDSGTQIGPNTISFARSGSKVYLRYKEKIYDQDQNGQPQEAKTAPGSVTWYGLIDTPATATGYDEIFSFRVVPTSNNFVFVNRFDESKGAGKLEKTVNTYYYDQTKPTDKLSLLFSTLPNSSKKPSYPIIGSISPEGKYISFNMYSCWNCGEHTPETMLVNVSTKQTKRLGETSYFSWKQNGAYEYKEYIAQPCPTPTGTGEFMQVDCPKDPSTLPLKTGTI